jgi:H+/gluconate symporter-like permease
MSALPGTPAIQNAIPMPFFGTTPLAAPGLGIIASGIMLDIWLGHARKLIYFKCSPCKRMTGIRSTSPSFAPAADGSLGA